MYKLPEPVENSIKKSLNDAPSQLTPIGGGSICDAYLLGCESGLELFLKTNLTCPDDLFSAEAEGLKALDKAGVIRIPKVHRTGVDFILLEFIHSAVKPIPFWEELGAKIADLHRTTFEEYGFPIDNYCGLTRQLNTLYEDGYQFFIENRLLYQAHLAYEHERLTFYDVQRIEDICERLHDLVPEQPASLIHGDLWQGNLHIDESGAPVLIDPATYWGWREADIAMMDLFGDPPDCFYQAYNEAFPLEPGYKERFDLYNLYHLLNHLNLFGSCYYRQVMYVTAKYC